MPKNVVLLTIPGLREKDLENMPKLQKLVAGGTRSALSNNFPAVTWPAQANMLTGKLPDNHGVIANGFYWREEQKVEMWTAWNKTIQSPQIWDLLHQKSSAITSAAWFPMLSKGCGADYICMPAPIHNPDGSEELWCYTQPQDFYKDLLEPLQHFPLQNFWGPIANIKSTQWIADSAGLAAHKFQPNFFYIYLPHLDYAAQKLGPDSELAITAVTELDEVIGSLEADFNHAYQQQEIVWMIVSEYVITDVNHVSYPNRLLRDAGLLKIVEQDGEHLDLENSDAWAMVDHQFSHVFIKNSDSAITRKVKQLFSGCPGIADVLANEERAQYHLNHERSGDVILISQPDSWQAYYWWNDDAKAPPFARTVDIHRKPGYDPVELHFDRTTRSTPLDATLVRGSHGAPVESKEQRGILLTSTEIGAPESIHDTDICGLVVNQF
jgi:predicted AlkP superfamily pyrophosphatase or phosphodiesterase